MTAGSPDVLVLGLGNLLLSDDGLGLRVLEEVSADGVAEYVDGGTQGLALLPYLAGRRAVIVLDAVALGAPPGTVHVLSRGVLAAHRRVTAHGSNALELLDAAELIGDLPAEVRIIGIEPAKLETGIGLSAEVEAAIPEAAAAARRAVSECLPAGCP